MKQITAHELTAMSEQAASVARLRAHRTLHEELSDPVQRLAIAMEPGTYIRPHRHPQTWELLTPLRGRFVVLQFNDDGVVTQRTLLG
ncbi:WbuC family cupin fold metalloprotein, partial [Serratia marcescens]